MSDATTTKAGYRLIPELREMVEAGTLVFAEHHQDSVEYHIPALSAQAMGPQLQAIPHRLFVCGDAAWIFWLFDEEGVSTQAQAAAWIKERMVRDGG